MDFSTHAKPRHITEKCGLPGREKRRRKSRFTIFATIFGPVVGNFPFHGKLFAVIYPHFVLRKTGKREEWRGWDLCLLGMRILSHVRGKKDAPISGKCPRMWLSAKSQLVKPGNRSGTRFRWFARSRSFAVINRIFWERFSFVPS